MNLLIVLTWLIGCLTVSSADARTASVPLSSGVNNHLRRAEEIKPHHYKTDPYNYTCTREDRLSGRCERRWCNRDVPNTSGSWAPFPPYWQLPAPCSNQAFGLNETQKCMHGRTLYVVGNSIARQNAFNMVELLGGDPVKREDQRDQCPKHQPVWGDSCHSDMAGVKIKYLYLQFMDGYYYDDRGGFPFFRYQKTANGKTEWVTGRLPYNDTTTGETKYYNDIKAAHADENAEVWTEDNCVHQSTRECLAKFFAGSTSRDVMVFTLGMAYGMYNLRKHGNEPEHSPSVDYHAWLVASAAAFKAHIGATFPGQVFRATLAEYQASTFMSPMTPNLAVVNNVLDMSWRPGSEDLPWYTIDQWAINKNRHHLYADAVHFTGLLSHALLQQVLNELCPGGGVDSWQYGDNMAQVISHTDKTHVVYVAQPRNSAAVYIVYKGKSHHIPDMDTLDGLEVPGSARLDLSKDEFSTIPVGEPLVPCDKTWVPNTCKDSVYYKALHGL